MTKKIQDAEQFVLDQREYFHGKYQGVDADKLCRTYRRMVGYALDIDDANSALRSLKRKGYLKTNMTTLMMEFV